MRAWAAPAGRRAARVCVRCVVVLFRNNLGVSASETFEMVGEAVYEALVFTGKCRRP